MEKAMIELNTKLSDCATLNDLIKLENKFEEYTPLQYYVMLKNEMINTVKTEDFRLHVLELADVQKDLKRYVLIDEQTRMVNLLKEDLNEKIDSKADDKFVQKQLKKLEVLIENGVSISQLYREISGNPRHTLNLLAK